VLKHLIDREINRDKNTPQPLIRKAWRLLFEAFDKRPEQAEHDWYSFEDLVRADGWTEGALREFERVSRPCLVAKRPLGSKSTPPKLSDEPHKLRELIHFEVAFLGRPQTKIDFPLAVLPSVAAALRRGLEHAATLLADLETEWWRTPTLYPDEKPGERYLDKTGAHFLWFAEMYDRLCEADRKRARRELLAWPRSESLFFDKLRTWVSAKSEIVSAADAMNDLLALSQDVFWSSDHRRELLRTLRARWVDWSPGERQAIEDRIIQGPEQWSEENDEDYKRRRAIDSATRLGWMTSKGLELSKRASDELPRLRAADPRWRESWDAHADESMEGRSGWVKIDTDPGDLSGIPISEIVARARQLQRRPIGEFVEYDPFRGLVEKRPSRALAALSFESRHGRFSTDYWDTLLSHWPQTASPRAACLLAHRVSRLPKHSLVELRYSGPRWLSQHLPRMIESRERDVWPVWDAVFNALTEVGPEARKSAIAEVHDGGSQHSCRSRNLI
jgi:hypothetical protein